MTELRDSAIWAATCDLKARVLPNTGRPLAVRTLAPGLVLLAAGLIALAVVPVVVGGLLVVLGVVLVIPGVSLVRAPGHLMLEADGVTYRVFAGRSASVSWQDCGEFGVVDSTLLAPGHVTWSAADGGPGGAFLPGAASLPPEDLAVLLNRYRQRFAPGGGDPSRG